MIYTIKWKERKVELVKMISGLLCLSLCNAFIHSQHYLCSSSSKPRWVGAKWWFKCYPEGVQMNESKSWQCWMPQHLTNAATQKLAVVICRISDGRPLLVHICIIFPFPKSSQGVLLIIQVVLSQWKICFQPQMNNTKWKHVGRKGFPSSLYISRCYSEALF